ATQRLGQGEDVRDDAELFECKESSCPAHAALDLVEYKEGAGFGTSFPDGLHVLFRWDPDTCVSLDRFHDDTGSAVRDLVDVFHFVEVNKGDIGEQWAERLFFYFITGDTEGPVCAAMIGFSARDDFSPAGVTLCQFQSTLVGFRPGVDEVAAIKVVGKYVGQLFRQQVWGRLDELTVDHHVHVAVDLVLDGGLYTGISVAQTAYTNT